MSAISNGRRHTKLRTFKSVVFPDCGRPTTERYGATKKRSTSHVLRTKSARTWTYVASTLTHREIRPSRRLDQLEDDTHVLVPLQRKNEIFMRLRLPTEVRRSPFLQSAYVRSQLSLALRRRSRAIGRSLVLSAGVMPISGEEMQTCQRARLWDLEIVDSDRPANLRRHFRNSLLRQNPHCLGCCCVSPSEDSP